MTFSFCFLVSMCRVLSWTRVWGMCLYMCVLCVCVLVCVPMYVYLAEDGLKQEYRLTSWQYIHGHISDLLIFIYLYQLHLVSVEKTFHTVGLVKPSVALILWSSDPLIHPLILTGCHRVTPSLGRMSVQLPIGTLQGSRWHERSQRGAGWSEAMRKG